MNPMDLIVGSLAVVAPLIAVSGAWIAWRARTLEQFREKASGATHALGQGDRRMATHLTGEAAPRAAGVRTWVPSLGAIATNWVDALQEGDLIRARAEEQLFEKNARWVGFAR
jgi:hypothetical protein